MDAPGTYIVLNELVGNPPPALSPLQEFLARHIDVLIMFWQALWLIVALAVFGTVVQQYITAHARRVTVEETDHR